MAGLRPYQVGEGRTGPAQTLSLGRNLDYAEEVAIRVFQPTDSVGSAPRRVRSRRCAVKAPRLVMPMSFGCWPLKDDYQKVRCDGDREYRKEGEPGPFHPASIGAGGAPFKNMRGT